MVKKVGKGANEENGKTRNYMETILMVSSFRVYMFSCLFMFSHFFIGSDLLFPFHTDLPALFCVVRGETVLKISKKLKVNPS